MQNEMVDGCALKFGVVYGQLLLAVLAAWAAFMRVLTILDHQ